MAQQSQHAWRGIVRRRLSVAAGLLLVWSFAIEARLVYFQVFEHDELLAMAADRQQRTIDLDARRGDIVDRHGRLFATSIETDTIVAVPTEVAKPADTVAAICRVLRDCTADERKAWVERLSRRALYAQLRRHISPGEAREIEALGLQGISFRREIRRFYPNKELAANLLGFVNMQNEGGAGLEARYDRLLRGTPGKGLVQIDAKRRPFVSVVKEPASIGASLELTIDATLQHVADRELQAAVARTGANGGAVVVMDPFTGEVLALATSPTYNPNNFRTARAEVRKNHAVEAVYEPGSTFKLITASAALEEKVVRPDQLINTSPGVIRIGNSVVDEAQGHNYGTLTFEDVIVKSSNVGAIKIGFQIGPERMAEYVSRFGFGRLTSPDFRNGESAGLVTKASELTPRALASVSMGYQIAVTPMQMAAALSAVANGGELIEPRVVRAFTNDGVRVPVPRHVVRRSISETTARQLTTMMEAVVDRGTAKAAQIAGYTVAGKTGTAAKAIPGGYSATDYNVSFVGFVPSREPVFAIVVVVDTPRKVSAYGGTVAAPVFQKIAEAALRHRAVPPTLHRAPPVLIARREERREQPTSGPADAAPVVMLPADTLAGGAAVPDLTGTSARDAVRTLIGLGLTPRVHGTGYVVRQRPAPGAALDEAGEATVWLQRRLPPPAPSAETPPAVGTGMRSSP